MARGGLSSDPEKRKRQLDALRRGNERAAARLTELESPAEPAAAEPEPTPASKPGSRRVEVGKVTLPKPGKAQRRSRAKRESESQAEEPIEPGSQPAPAARPKREWSPPRHGLSLPFGRDDG